MCISVNVCYLMFYVKQIGSPFKSLFSKFLVFRINCLKLNDQDLKSFPTLKIWQGTSIVHVKVQAKIFALKAFELSNNYLQLIHKTNFRYYKKWINMFHSGKLCLPMWILGVGFSKYFVKYIYPMFQFLVFQLNKV